jgi:hypothetical protein
MNSFYLTMKIDHVTIAGSDLKELEKQFLNIGMKSDYGGPHSNGVTHMALLGFDDGSYIELISTIKPNMNADLWGKQITENGGPCAWAVQVNGIASEVSRIKKRGIATIGPDDYSRKRPDGVLVEWQLAFIGDKPPGATLPFLIEDKTPRDYRTKPSMSVSQGGKAASAKLSGLKKVIIGISNLEEGIATFQRAFEWKDPKRCNDCLEGAITAEFADTPVILAAPKANESWLGKRLRQFGDSPCAFLIGTGNIEKAKEMFGSGSEQEWLGHKISWIPPSNLGGSMLGFID